MSSQRKNWNLFEERRKCLFATHSCAHLAYKLIMLSSIQFHLLCQMKFIYLYSSWSDLKSIVRSWLLRSLNWFYVLKCIKYFIVSAKQYIQANQIKITSKSSLRKKKWKKVFNLLLIRSINEWMKGNHYFIKNQIHCVL